MFNVFSKGRLSALLALLSLSAMNSSLTAWESCDPSCEPSCNRMYVGAFGGGIYSDSTKVSQMGTAFFVEAQGGPLAVLAEGRTKKTSTGFGGAQIGYEWAKCPDCCSGWSLATAGELEAYFYSHKKKGYLVNPTERLDAHDFIDSFQANTSVILVNAVFSLKNSTGFVPYISGGIGATHISLRNAKAIQVDPLENQINHFNSKRNDSSWAFAAQAKAGLRYNICNSFHIFGEYRYLFVDSSNYIFGSTVYPGHAPTSPWNLKFKDSNFNAFAIGIQFDL